MDVLLFKRNGMLLSKRPSRVAKRRVLTLSALLTLGLLLPACQTNSTGINAQCAPWRKITYSAKGDTAVTIKEVRVHDQTGVNLGCWK